MTNIVHGVFAFRFGVPVVTAQKQRIWRIAEAALIGLGVDRLTPEERAEIQAYAFNGFE
ncbi:hypothetical protein ACLMAJ_25990 [Nocardia sp. KC 131]|uniref:hypothetical protein n=1 Tax=Nocardia arseniciresistens TaxID=3392119 RepID=UPI00398E6C3F